METTPPERAHELRRIGDFAKATILNADLLRRLIRDVDALEEALGALVARLDLIHDNEEYQGVWVLHQVHGGKYEGPTYTAELDQARAVLELPPATGG